MNLVEQVSQGYNNRFSRQKKKERLAESTSRFQAHEHRPAGDVRSRRPPWDCVRSSDGATANAQEGFQFRLSLNWTYLGTKVTVGSVN